MNPIFRFHQPYTDNFISRDGIIPSLSTPPGPYDMRSPKTGHTPNDLISPMDFARNGNYFGQHILYVNYAYTYAAYWVISF